MKSSRVRPSIDWNIRLAATLQEKIDENNMLRTENERLRQENDDLNARLDRIDRGWGRCEAELRKLI